MISLHLILPLLTPHPYTLQTQHLILPLFAPPPRQSSSYSGGVGVMIIKDVVSGVSGWGVKISHNLDRLAFRVKILSFEKNDFFLPISVHNYVTLKPNLYLRWSLPLNHCNQGVITYFNIRISNIMSINPGAVMENLCPCKPLTQNTTANTALLPHLYPPHPATTLLCMLPVIRIIKL